MPYMMFLLILTLSLMGCGGENNSGATAPENEITASSFFGVWEYTYPGTQCTETYQFSEPDSVAITSLDEFTSGYYSVESEDYDTNRHTLRIQIHTDNNMADCHGNTNDDVAGIVEVYVEFVNQNEITVFSERYADDPGQLWIRTEN